MTGMRRDLALSFHRIVHPELNRTIPQGGMQENQILRRNKEKAERAFSPHWFLSKVLQVPDCAGLRNLERKHGRRQRFRHTPSSSLASARSRRNGQVCLRPRAVETYTLIISQALILSLRPNACIPRMIPVPASCPGVPWAVDSRPKSFNLRRSALLCALWK